MKLKFPLIIISVFLFSSLSIAQNDSNSSKYSSPEFFPKKGDMGTTLLMSGLIDNIQLESQSVELGKNILFLRYYLEDDLVLRLGLGIDFRNYKNEVADSVGLSLVTGDSLNRMTTFNISGGIEKHLESSNRLDPYVFGQLNLTFVGKEVTEINAAVNTSAGTGRVEQTIKTDGGFGIGLVVGGGLNYFIAKRFSLGTELGLVLQYSNIGGTTSNNTITTPINGNSSSDFKTSDDQVKLTEIKVNTNALINLSYFF